jgi:membrane-bound lytic murein transglycosylase A
MGRWPLWADAGLCLILVAALASCARGGEAPAPAPAPPAEPSPELPAPPPEPAVETALQAGVREGPALASLGLNQPAAARALAAFRISCPSLLKRDDASGLTRNADWSAACAAAPGWADADAVRFFDQHFEVAEVGDGNAFATGYFEPQIAGARSRGPGFEVPVFGLPADLVEADLGLFSDSLKGRRIRGRVEDRRFVPYHDRAAIEDGALAGRGLEIAWAADPVELFFLEVQGSGQLALPDGQVMRIGYAGQNGREYVAIGKLMRERGLLQPGGTSMQAIKAWLRANPAEGRKIMRENRSYIFFREITGPGPIGALGHPVTPRATVAADPKFVPLGAPVALALDRPEASGLWVAQDTGGAIKGANRFDTFWGAGEEAAKVAGGMAAKGKAWLLLPKGSIARTSAGGPQPSQ